MLPRMYMHIFFHKTISKDQTNHKSYHLQLSRYSLLLDKMAIFKSQLERMVLLLPSLSFETILCKIFESRVPCSGLNTIIADQKSTPYMCQVFYAIMLLSRANPRHSNFNKQQMHRYTQPVHFFTMSSTRIFIIGNIRSLHSMTD